jgi:hypothetical protein
VSVVCCQVEVSATDWSLVQKSSTDCGGFVVCVWSRNLENVEANARYRAAKIQPQWVVTPGKQTNKHYTIVIKKFPHALLRILFVPQNVIMLNSYTCGLSYSDNLGLSLLMSWHFLHD